MLKLAAAPMKVLRRPVICAYNRRSQRTPRQALTQFRVQPSVPSIANETGSLKAER